MSRVGGGGGVIPARPYKKVKKQLLTVFWNQLTQVAPNLMDVGEKPKIFPNLGIFVIEIPKIRNFGFLWIWGNLFSRYGYQKKGRETQVTTELVKNRFSIFFEKNYTKILKMSRVGGGGHTIPPLSNRSKTTVDGFLDLVDIGGNQSYGSG